MAKKISLREFQQSVVTRLQDLEHAAPSSSKLGMQVGSQSWLVDLSDVGEAIPVPALASVPLTHPWFSGVANIRGNLYGAVDFSAFLGGEPSTITPNSRLVLVNPKYAINSGLVVSRILGLRTPDQFQRKEMGQSNEPWVSAEYTDTDGNSWRELNMQALIQDPNFLQVGI
jgi:twitching motility protein PilI